MNGYDRVTFGHPDKESERVRRYIDQYDEPHLDTNKNQASKGYLRQRYVPASREINKEALREKLSILSQQLFEVIFLKESVMSMVGEQRVKMGDFIRELKKYLFQLGVKAERDSLTKQPKALNESSQIEFKQGSSQFIPGDSRQLQRMCQELMQENAILKQKYEQMLMHYRSEIQSLSNALAKPQEQLSYGNQQIRELKQIAMDSQQKLRQQQIRFAERVKYLQSEILALEDEYLKEKQSYQRQLDQYRLKERHFIFQESQIQRKNILLIERQKQLTEREIIAKQQKNALDRRENKVSDYEHNQLRRERQHLDQQKHALRSEYYINYDRPPRPPEPKLQHVNRFNIDTKSERQKSAGRLVNSRVDINARLREIQMEKKNNYGGVKNSRMSQAGGLRNDRSSSKGRNQVMGLGYQAPRKEIPPQNVNVKLQSMLQSLNRDLSDMK